MACEHKRFTDPVLFDLYREPPANLKVLGQAQIRVCLSCGFTNGWVKAGFIYDSHTPFEFTAEDGKNIEANARAALLDGLSRFTREPVV